jgi:hypothetical protein
MDLGIVRTSSSSYYLRAGMNSGAPGGYASSADAITAAKLLSAGNAPTLAILDAGTAFFPVATRMANSNFNLAFTDHKSVYNLNQNVRAFVEGGTVVPVPAGATAIEFKPAGSSS